MNPSTTAPRRHGFFDPVPCDVVIRELHIVVHGRMVGVSDAIPSATGHKREIFLVALSQIRHGRLRELLTLYSRFGRASDSRSVSVTIGAPANLRTVDGCVIAAPSKRFFFRVVELTFRGSRTVTVQVSGRLAASFAAALQNNLLLGDIT
jgi:hypothetical protein